MSPADTRAGGPAPSASGGSAAAPLPSGSGHGTPPLDAVTPPEHQSFWLWVMCLLGLNYFSTLAYQPSIAFEAAGLLAPLATVVLVTLTLFCALPVLRRVAKKSPLGLGSIGLNRRFFGGWIGRAFVVVGLGVVATDFIVTKTLSASDAAEHLIHNPLWASLPAALQNGTLVAMALVVLMGAFFLRRIRHVIFAAVVLVGTYLLLSCIIIWLGLWHLATHLDLVTGWYENVMAGRWQLEDAPLAGHGALSILLICLLLYPKLAIGFSGLETGSALMPLACGDPDDSPKKPLGRIRETRKLVSAAGLIMSIMLLGSSVVTTMLIRPEALLSDGPAANRALAFLAHGQTPVPISPLFGTAFGTIYDVSTVATLWFAGASALSVLLNLAPRYVDEFSGTSLGTKTIWTLVLVSIGAALLVTWIFDAGVEAQAAACATMVLLWIASDCLGVMLVDWKRRRGAWYKKLSWRYLAVMLVFLYGAIAIFIEKPAGILIAGAMVLLMIVVSMVLRVRRGVKAGELAS
jgi:hypothetical protein